MNDGSAAAATSSNAIGTKRLGEARLSEDRVDLYGKRVTSGSRDIRRPVAGRVGGNSTYRQCTSS